VTGVQTCALPILGSALVEQIERLGARKKTLLRALRDMVIGYRDATTR